MDPYHGHRRFSARRSGGSLTLSHSAGTCTCSMTCEEQGLARTGGQGLALLLGGTFAMCTLKKDCEQTTPHCSLGEQAVLDRVQARLAQRPDARTRRQGCASAHLVDAVVPVLRER